MTARDSNRGGCCQSCRWDYDLLEVDEDGELDLYYDGEGEVTPFAMSPKDLKLIEYSGLILKFCGSAAYASITFLYTDTTVAI